MHSLSSAPTSGLMPQLHNSNLKVMTSGERRTYEDASRHLEEQEKLLHNSLEIPTHTLMTQQKCIFVMANESFNPRTLTESGFKVIRRHPHYGDPKWRSLISKETAKIKPELVGSHSLPGHD